MKGSWWEAEKRIMYDKCLGRSFFSSSCFLFFFSSVLWISSLSFIHTVWLCIYSFQSSHPHLLRSAFIAFWIPRA